MDDNLPLRYQILFNKQSTQSTFCWQFMQYVLRVEYSLLLFQIIYIFTVLCGINVQTYKLMPFVKSYDLIRYKGVPSFYDLEQLKLCLIIVALLDLHIIWF